MKDSQGDRDYLSTFTNFVDRHVKEVKYVYYGLGFVGLVIIGRSVHITARFCATKDVPQHFIQRGIRVNFRPERCDAHGRIISKHIPLLEFTRPKNKGLLAIHLAGVEHTDQSVTWLQENVIDQVIRCDILNARNDEDLDCMVYVKTSWIRRRCLNQYLIEQGLAMVSEDADLNNHSRSGALLEQLVRAEIKAEKRGRGVWQRPTVRQRIKNYPAHIQEKLHLNVFKNMYRKFKEFGAYFLERLKR